MRIAGKALARYLERTSSLEIPMLKWKDYIKTDLTEFKWEKWINLAQDRDLRRDSVNLVIDH
jgi:hypothetical protein